MFYLIEKQDQLDRIKELGSCFINIIPYNRNFHPKLQNKKISLIYLRSINSYKGYMFCINHSESLSLDLDKVWEFIVDKTDDLFVLNKKDFLHYINGYVFGLNQEIYDLNFMNIIHNGTIIEDKEPYSLIDQFYEKFPNNEFTNGLIPISKHYEQQENIYSIVKEIIKNKHIISSKVFSFCNLELTNVFYNIELNGLTLDKEKYVKFFSKIQNPEFNINKGKIYTKYNLYTLTGRPSNMFNGINFGALKKDNGERAVFIPENDLFIELDINAYHPRLIGKKINYKLSNENLYDSVGIEKIVMFENLYGGIKKENLNNPFLKEINDYIEWMWEYINKFGVYDAEVRKYSFQKYQIDNKNKLFNWIIQSLETYENSIIIYKINSFLFQNNKKTRLVHTVYDSFLFDYSKSDGDIIETIKNLIEFPTRIKIGHNYDALQ